MNQKRFEKEVRVILSRESREKVEEFLQDINYHEAIKLMEFTEFMDRGLSIITDDQYAKDSAMCLKLLERIEKKTKGHVNDEIQNGFQSVTGWLKNVAVLNKEFKHKGRPPKLSETEYRLLIALQIYFIRCFPKRSSKFTQDTLLFKIGELLIGGELPKDTYKQLLKRPAV